jgi:hypothetical protein
MLAPAVAVLTASCHNRDSYGACMGPVSMVFHTVCACLALQLSRGAHGKRSLSELATQDNTF